MDLSWRGVEETERFVLTKIEGQVRDTPHTLHVCGRARGWAPLHCDVTRDCDVMRLASREIRVSAKAALHKAMHQTKLSCKRD